MRSFAFGISALLGASVAFLLIWQLVLPNFRQRIIKPSSIHLPSIANEWSSSIREDMQFQSDVGRIERELATLLQFKPFPYSTQDQDFDRKVESIEQQLLHLESQSGRR